MSPEAIVLPLLFYGGLNWGDYKSTKAALKAPGTIEGAPLTALIGIKPAKIIGTLVLTTGDVALQKYGDQVKSHRGLWIYRGAVGLVYGAAIVHNYRIAQGRP